MRARVCLSLHSVRVKRGEETYQRIYRNKRPWHGYENSWTENVR